MVAATLAIYTHLFSWLWVGPLTALLAMDLFRQRRQAVSVGRARALALVFALVLLPQIIHGFIALAYTSERHALYGGASAHGQSFSRIVTETLFLGENWRGPGTRRWLVLLPLALFVLGLWLARARAWVAAMAIVLPGLALSWVASQSHQIEARYLNYLVPVVALCMGVGIAKLRRPALLAPLALAVATVSVHATEGCYAGQPTDWYDGSARIDALTGPDDVVAVFPGYWAATLRRYSSREDLVPVTYPIDLERVLSRGKHVILVRNFGRYFGHLQAWLRTHARSQVLFSTHVRDAFDVIAIDAAAAEPVKIHQAQEPALVIGGLVGSGGYPWQREAQGVSAFARLRPLFGAATAVVVGYDTYDPPWYQALRWGADGLHDMRPNRAVDAALRSAGISHVALRCIGVACSSARSALAANHIGVLPALAPAQPDARHTIDIAGTPVELLHLTCDAPAAPACPERIAHARGRLQPGARLVVLLAQRGDYARTANALERTMAHALIDAGADVVAGEGGYAAREVEEYHSGVIAYSLGTLLRPRAQALSASDSSGIVLRLRFPRDGAPRFQAFATTFDDRSEPALASAASIQRLVSDADAGQASTLDKGVAGGEAAYADRHGVWRTLGAFRRGDDALVASMPAWLEQRLAPFLQWFPLALKWTRLRPFDGGFAADGAYAGLRGVLSLGVFRRALELDTGGKPRVRLRLRSGLHGQIAVAYAVPDDRLASKYIPFEAQRLIVRIDQTEVLRSEVPYCAGWSQRLVRPPHGSRVPSQLEIEVQSRTHFPIAIDVFPVAARP